MPVTRSNLRRGYSIALLSAAILSTTAILLRYLTQTYHIPPLVLAFWRDFIVAATLLPILGILGSRFLRVPSRHLLFLFGYGVILAIFNSLWITSVALAGAAIATVLVYTSAAFTALLGRWLFKESLDWVKIVVILACILGCALVAGAIEPGAWRTDLLGVLTGALSGLTYSAYSLMGRAASKKGLNPWTTLLYTFGFAALVLLGFNLIPGRLLPGAAADPGDLFWLGDAWKGWAILFFVAAGPTVLGFGLYNVSLGYLPSSLANLVLTVEPVFTIGNVIT